MLGDSHLVYALCVIVISWVYQSHGERSTHPYWAYLRYGAFAPVLFWSPIEDCFRS